MEVAADLEESTEAASNRRRLILRDSLTFFALTAITVALFTVTLLLFRSFAAHRSNLGTLWFDRGRSALDHHQPEQSIDALRTALSYAPGERPYELLLAQALAQAGHTEEAYNYFSGLWDDQPGDGFINLELARLAAAKLDRQSAVNYYRASIYGTWEGDGAVRRRTVRLELIRYLLQQGDSEAAHAELLVAQGNSADDPTLSVETGPLFEQAGDAREALATYTRWSQADPADPRPLAAAGRLAYDMGEFATAQHLLEGALHTGGGQPPDREIDRATAKDRLDRTNRILELIPSRKLPSEQRVSRLLTMSSIARNRLEQCSATPGGATPTMRDLGDRWQAERRTGTRRALLHEQSRQDVLLRLIYDTETEAASRCGAPSGDDALMLMLARNPKALDQ